jgi:hypothetical protein
MVARVARLLFVIVNHRTKRPPALGTALGLNPLARTAGEGGAQPGGLGG